MKRALHLSFVPILVTACSLDAGVLPPVDRDSSRADAARDSALGDSTVTDSSRDSSRTDSSVADSGAIDTGVVDTGVPDAGGPRDFYDLDWAAPTALSATADPPYCETDAAVTPDGRWLLFTRNTDVTGCYFFRRIFVMPWNSGAPSGPARMLPTFDASAFPETNVHPMAGDVLSMPGRLLLYHAAQPGGAERDIRAQWLDPDSMGAPTLPVGAPLSASINTGAQESDPTLTADGTELLFASSGDLFSARGTPPTSYAAATPIDALNTATDEFDPALSPDGRVLVFARRRATASFDLDLFVARRRDPATPFTSATRLPRGATEINTSANELDCFIAANGDLLFTSERNGATRLFLATALP